MALQTFNSTAYLTGVAKSVYVGDQTVAATITTAAGSLSAGDVFNWLKMPRGAKISDIQFRGVTTGTLLVLNIGDPGSASRHGVTSFTATTENKLPSSLSLSHEFVSLSDDVNEWAFRSTVSSQTSVSGATSITVQVTYRVDAL
jgi:hypothetical protein